MEKNEHVEKERHEDAPAEEEPTPSSEQNGTPTAEASQEQAGGEEVSAGEMSEYISEIEALKEEREEINERLLRMAAELQNFRRRAEEEKGRLITSSKARAVEPMLEVLDDFERTLEAAEQLDAEEDTEKAYRSLKEGVELVFQKFKDELARLGVEPIEAEGQPFDEKEHEAMMQEPAPDDVEPGTVLREVQKGYRLDDRVLRHSKVIVGS